MTTEIEVILALVLIIVAMLGTVLLRVWKIPMIEAKLDTVIKDTERNRQSIHQINNHLNRHEMRLTLLEKSPPCRHPSPSLTPPDKPS